MNEQTIDAIAAFWFLFRRLAVGLATMPSADNPTYDELLKSLHEVDAGLYVEFSGDGSDHELVITADGDSELFTLVRSVVAASPGIQGWTIRALKPKRGFPETVRWKSVTLLTATIVFDPLETDGSLDLGLRILVPGIRASEIEDAHEALLRAIDQGLGEERHAAEIRYTQVQPLPHDADASSFIPLRDLDAFIEWRTNKRRGGAR